LRHTSLKKNKTDNVESAADIPLRYFVALTAAIDNAIKPFLAAEERVTEEIEKMYRARRKLMQLQVAL
jgi:hypothetical protein